jgi:hypothetical protein
MPIAVIARQFFDNQVHVVLFEVGLNVQVQCWTVELFANYASAAAQHQPVFLR